MISSAKLVQDYLARPAPSVQVPVTSSDTATFVWDDGQWWLSFGPADSQASQNVINEATGAWGWYDKRHVHSMPDDFAAWLKVRP